MQMYICWHLLYMYVICGRLLLNCPYSVQGAYSYHVIIVLASIDMFNTDPIRCLFPQNTNVLASFH